MKFVIQKFLRKRRTEVELKANRSEQNCMKKKEDVLQRKLVFEKEEKTQEVNIWRSKVNFCGKRKAKQDQVNNADSAIILLIHH